MTYYCTDETLFSSALFLDLVYAIMILKSEHRHNKGEEVSMKEEVLYAIFLDLQKVYDALDRVRCL